MHGPVNKAGILQGGTRVRKPTTSEVAGRSTHATAAAKDIATAVEDVRAEADAAP